MANKLKPCPFCGGEPKICERYTKIDSVSMKTYEIICERCGTRSRKRLSFVHMNENASTRDCKERLIADWNARTVDGISKETANEIDEMFLAKCQEVNELKKKLEVNQSAAENPKIKKESLEKNENTI